MTRNEIFDRDCRRSMMTLGCVHEEERKRISRERRSFLRIYNSSWCTLETSREEVMKVYAGVQIGYRMMCVCDTIYHSQLVLRGSAVDRSVSYLNDAKKTFRDLASTR